jgi:hypothetical protein
MCLKLSRLTVISHVIQSRQTLRWVLVQASDVKNCKQYAHLSLKTGETHTMALDTHTFSACSYFAWNYACVYFMVSETWSCNTFGIF